MGRPNRGIGTTGVKKSNPKGRPQYNTGGKGTTKTSVKEGSK